MSHFGINYPVIEILNEYLSFKNHDFAILINGEWGSGKTYLIKKYIDYLLHNKTEINDYYIDQLEICYLSLFGMETTDEIDQAIFKYFHPLLSSNKFKMISKIGSFILNKIPFSCSLPLSPEDCENISSFIGEFSSNHNNLILILDDFERNNINKQALLGYINNQIEQFQVKIIIISNSNSLDNDDKFREIKEKVIGKTINVLPEVSSVLKNNIEDIKSDEIKTIFLRNIGKLEKIFNHSNSQNLRHFKKIIFEFIMLYDNIDNKYKKNTELVDTLLSTNFIMSIEIHGKYRNLSDIIDLESEYWIRKASGDNTKCLKTSTLLYNKYKINYLILTPKFWYNFISNGIISLETLNKGCKIFIEEQELNNKFAPLKLHDMYIMDENDIEKLFIQMKRELYSNEYNKLGIFLHAWGNILEGRKFDFITDSNEEIIRKFNTCLNNIKFELNDNDYLDPGYNELIWYHKKIHGQDSEEFNIIYTNSLKTYRKQYINNKEKLLK